MHYFSDESLQEHDELIRQQLINHITGLVDSYAEACRRQAVAQGEGSNVELLRGSLEAAQFLSSVLTSTPAR